MALFLNLVFYGEAFIRKVGFVCIMGGERKLVKKINQTALNCNHYKLVTWMLKSSCCNNCYSYLSCE